MLYCVGSVNGTVIAGQTGVGGSWSYQFNLPTSITFDQYGNMYVLDSGNNRIQRWWPNSTYGITVASSGSLWNPRGMSFDRFGNLVVADLSNHRVVSFINSCRKLTALQFFKISSNCFRKILGGCVKGDFVRFYW